MQKYTKKIILKTKKKKFMCDKYIRKEVTPYEINILNFINVSNVICWSFWNFLKLYQHFENFLKLFAKNCSIVQIVKKKLKVGLKFEFGNFIYMLHFEKVWSMISWIEHMKSILLSYQEICLGIIFECMKKLFLKCFTL